MFHLTIRAAWMNSAAEAAHECTYWNVAVVSVDGVALSVEGEPRKRIRLGIRDRDNSHH